jgi:uncharacterized OB-fold protein
MRWTTLAAVAALLSGCSSPATPDEPLGTDGLDGGPDGANGLLNVTGNDTVEVLVPLPVDFQGELGTFVHGCVFPAGECHTQTVKADVTDLIVERPGANFTALSLDVAWDAESEFTRELAVGFMVMDRCPGCPDVFYPEVQDESPIHIEIDGESVPLNETAVVHVYVYNPNSFHMPPPGLLGYAYVSSEQAFTITGNVTVREAADA